MDLGIAGWVALIFGASVGVGEATDRNQPRLFCHGRPIARRRGYNFQYLIEPEHA
jgi:hypothetical protein